MIEEQNLSSYIIFEILKNLFYEKNNYHIYYFFFENNNGPCLKFTIRSALIFIKQSQFFVFKFTIHLRARHRMRKLTTGTFGIECKSVLPIRIMRGVHMRMIVKTISDKGMSYIYYMLCYYLYVR